MESLVAPAINLFLLLGFLAYKLVGPLKAYAASRQGSIQQQLEESRSLLSSARAKFEDFDSRLRGLSAEIQTLNAQSAEDARRARSRLVQAAEGVGAGVVADATAACGAMRTDLLFGLRSELATRAVARAEEQIRSRLTGEDRARLTKEFSALMEKA